MGARGGRGGDFRAVAETKTPPGQSDRGRNYQLATDQFVAAGASELM
jgi:hypothetical protein